MVDPLQKLIYVGDPMCSWCWGFAPEIEDLAADFPVEVVVGGLRPGPNAQELGDKMASVLSQHWTDVAERSGQPFDTAFLDRRDGWVYDTEPAATAVVTVRDLAEPETLRYFTAVQHAFYAEGRDVTDFAVLTEIAGDFEVDQDDFAEHLGQPETRKKTWADFSQARNWGISGFPALVGELTGDRLALLANGWTEADMIRTRISNLVDQDLPGPDPR